MYTKDDEVQDMTMTFLKDGDSSTYTQPQKASIFTLLN
jgi:hypothetical protein